MRRNHNKPPGSPRRTGQVIAIVCSVSCFLATNLSYAQQSGTASDGSVVVNADHGSTVNVQLGHTQQELDDARRVSDQLKRQSGALTQQVAQLRNAISDLKTRLDQTTQGAHEQRELEELQGQLDAKTNDLTTAQRAQRDLEARAADADKRVVALARDLDEARERSEHDRLTPDVYHWVGFASAAVGCGAAIAFNMMASSARSDLKAALDSDDPAISEPDAKERANTVRQANLLQGISLGLWVLGSAVGAMYMLDLAKGEKTGLEVVAPEIGPGQLGLRVAGRWNTL